MNNANKKNNPKLIYLYTEAAVEKRRGSRAG